MPHAGGRFGETQSLRGLAVGKLLEMPEQDDLSIVIDKAQERRMKSRLKLAPQSLRRRSQSRIAQLCGQIERRAIIKRSAAVAVQLLLAIDGASLRTARCRR